MFAVLAAIAFAVSFFEYGGQLAVSGWLGQPGMLSLGLVLLAIHLVRAGGLGGWGDD